MAKHRILVVDDQEDNRIIYSTLLQHAGYDVLEAGDGAEGVRLAREHQPDLILMDLAMPVLTGWEAMGRLEHDPATSAIPVIALTAQCGREAGSAAREAGFRLLLSKPCERERLLEEVGALIRPGGVPAE